MQDEHSGAAQQLKALRKKQSFMVLLLLTKNDEKEKMKSKAHPPS